MANVNPYSSIEWALTPQAKELRDVLTALGMAPEIAMATLERLLPETIVYKLDEKDHE